jgi:branched-subunit amino acid aminotransferase/4-amino-4-deoxychorismate lyase
MRDLVIQMATRKGFEVREERVRPESVEGATALLLTNSVRGICPVGALDGHVYEPHPFAAQMHACYLDELARTRQEWS